MTIYNVQ